MCDFIVLLFYDGLLNLHINIQLVFGRAPLTLYVCINVQTNYHKALEREESLASFLKTARLVTLQTAKKQRTLLATKQLSATSSSIFGSHERKLVTGTTDASRTILQKALQKRNENNVVDDWSEGCRQ